MVLTNSNLVGPLLSTVRVSWTFSSFHLLEDGQRTGDHESDSHESDCKSAKDTNGHIGEGMRHEGVINDQHGQGSLEEGQTENKG